MSVWFSSWLKTRRGVDPSGAKTMRRPQTRAEVELAKLHAETDALRNSRYTEFTKAALATVTALVALGSLYLTARGQLRQSELTREAQRDELYANLVTRFGGDSALASRIAAATSLAIFLAEEDNPRHHTQIVSLFLTGAAADPNVEIRNTLRDLLVRYASTTSILALAEQNLRFQRDAADTLGLDLPSFKRAEWPVAADPDRAVVLGRLEWNIETLVHSLSARQRLRDLDLSGVMLAAARTGPRPARLTPNIEPGIEFTNVNLNGAVLSWLDFHSCTFDGVQLDGAVVSRTNFNTCEFKGAGTTLAGLLITSVTPSRAERLFPPAWVNSTIRAATLSSEMPNTPDRTAYFSFRGTTTWQLDRIPADFSECVPMSTRGRGEFFALPSNCEDLFEEEAR